MWEGNVARGAGSITAATSGAFDALPYSLPARIGAAEGKTSPEELLAAAHAACFTMGLAGELTGAGSPPERLDARCTITMDEVEGRGHLIVSSSIDVRAQAAGDRRGPLPAARPGGRRRLPVLDADQSERDRGDPRHARVGFFRP